MGRSSKGRSQNDRKFLKNLYPGWSDDLSFKSLEKNPAISMDKTLETFRNTPAASKLKTPTTFAEASALARIRYEQRLSCANATTPNVLSPAKSPLTPRNIFGSGLDLSLASLRSSIRQLSLTDSDSKHTESDLSNESAVSHIGSQAEGSIAIQLVQLSINPEYVQSDDSFSSHPDSKHNRGALAFLRLVEEMYAKQEQEKSRNEMFENLVVHMLDILTHAQY